MRCFSAVELIQGLGGYTMEKLTGKDAEESPCKIKRLEDVASIIRSLCDKLPLKLVQELEVELCVNSKTKKNKIIKIMEGKLNNKNKLWQEEGKEGQTKSSDESASSPTTAFIAWTSFPIA